MINIITKKIEWNDQILEINTGKIANQADGSVMVRMGDSIVLCTATAAKKPKEGINFFPLTVTYREMTSAAGKIPGGFFKRETKPSEKEVLVSRLIDRPIRPLFHHAFFNETHVVCTVFSYDPAYSTDILAMIGASAALAISGLPYQNIIAAARVGLINNEFVLNPSFEQLKNSDLDLVIAGTTESVMMVESEANLLSEEQMLEAIRLGHSFLQPVIKLIKELEEEAGKPKWQVDELSLEEIKEQISKLLKDDILSALHIREKKSRVVAFEKITTKALESFAGEETHPAWQIEKALLEVKSEILRRSLLAGERRIDGRGARDIRPISGEVSLLPKTHGSALFNRGETQSLVVATLGTAYDEQIVDSLDGEYKEHFMLNYIFPPYSVGEATPMRAPGRREIGHGKLAWRALNRVMPSKESFSYTVRVVSEITACNGSSSMATVCGSSMALMNAGVPIKAPVAGIAMGLIKDKDKHIILFDILGDEDALGDMDFKVAGSKDGITALQMDIKIDGVTFDIVQEALTQGAEGRNIILDEMAKIIGNINTQVSQYAPCIQKMRIDRDKIREVIGAGGKVIREICDSTNSKIDISDEGIVTIAAPNKDKLQAAISRIDAITYIPKIGETFEGTLVTVLDSISFVNYFGNKEGVLHISEVSNEHIPSLHGIFKTGDTVKVKIIGFDMKGKAKLTLVDKAKGDGENKFFKSKEKGSYKRPRSRSNEGIDDQQAKPERKYFS